MQVTNDEIVAYYESHQFIYTHFWSRTALHYGFWYDDTKMLAEAIVNTNRYVADVLAIDQNDVVFDAGCGVGGTSMYIAETTGARVEGVTLSPLQLKIAQENAARANGRVNITRQDYTRTSFGDGTFSKIFGIESVCHANDKLDFLREAFRIMKPGGRIAVVDAFLNRDDLDAEERMIYAKSIDGWIVPHLAPRREFPDLLQQAGFRNVAFHDMQKYISRSVDRIYHWSLLTYPVNFIKSKLGLVKENFSARYQKAVFDRKIAVYGVFVAEKTA